MSIPLEKQLQTLSNCGINLLPGITVEHLLASYDREFFEEEPFESLLVTLGSEVEVEPFGFFTDNIWHFDAECIEDHGDYVKIAHRMKDLTGDALPLEDINDYVDIEEGEAWLSFQLGGQAIKWEAEVEDDWIDPTILSRFVELLSNQPNKKRFTYLDLQGQDCLIGCSSPDQLEKLRIETGLDFQWLS